MCVCVCVFVSVLAAPLSFGQRLLFAAREKERERPEKEQKPRISSGWEHVAEIALVCHCFFLSFFLSVLFVDYETLDSTRSSSHSLSPQLPERNQFFFLIFGLPYSTKMKMNWSKWIDRLSWISKRARNWSPVRGNHRNETGNSFQFSSIHKN